MVKYLFIALLFFIGCQNIEIRTTHQWEANYLTTEEFYKNTKDINLSEGQTIWCISSDTMEYILKNK